MPLIGFGAMLVSRATKGMSMLKNVAKNRQFGAAVSKNSKALGLGKKPMNDDLVGASQFYRKEDVAAVRAANFGPKKPTKASNLPISSWSAHKNSQRK